MLLRLIIQLIVPPATMAFILLVSAPIFESNLDYPVPLKMYLPFEINKTNYYFIFLFQLIRIMYNGIVTAAHDLLFVGFNMRICHQIELLIMRFKNIPKVLKSAGKTQNKYELEDSLLTINTQHLEKIHE